MIITIKKDDGEVLYDTNKVADDNSRRNANVTISKIGTLSVVTEALKYASDSHQNNLEILLQNHEEAIVEMEEEEEVAVDTDSEES